MLQDNWQHQQFTNFLLIFVNNDAQLQFVYVYIFVVHTNIFDILITFITDIVKIYFIFLEQLVRIAYPRTLQKIYNHITLDITPSY